MRYTNSHFIYLLAGPTTKHQHSATWLSVYQYLRKLCAFPVPTSLSNR